MCEKIASFNKKVEYKVIDIYMQDRINEELS